MSVMQTNVVICQAFYHAYFSKLGSITNENPLTQWAFWGNLTATALCKLIYCLFILFIPAHVFLFLFTLFSCLITILVFLLLLLSSYFLCQHLSLQTAFWKPIQSLIHEWDCLALNWTINHNTIRISYRHTYLIRPQLKEPGLVLRVSNSAVVAHSEGTHDHLNDLQYKCICFNIVQYNKPYRRTLLLCLHGVPKQQYLRLGWKQVGCGESTYIYSTHTHTIHTYINNANEVTYNKCPFTATEYLITWTLLF